MGNMPADPTSSTYIYIHTHTQYSNGSVSLALRFLQVQTKLTYTLPHGPNGPVGPLAHGPVGHGSHVSHGPMRLMEPWGPATQGPIGQLAVGHAPMGSMGKWGPAQTSLSSSTLPSGLRRLKMFKKCMTVLKTCVLDRFWPSALTGGLWQSKISQKAPP